MSEAKTESSTMLPEQVKDGNGMSFESTPSSTDAEPSTSNEVSFEADAAEGFQAGRPAHSHLADLTCIGSSFTQVAGGIALFGTAEQRSLHRSREPAPEKSAEHERGGDELDQTANTEGDTHSVEEDISGNTDAGDETIGHVQVAEAEAKHSKEN